MRSVAHIPRCPACGFYQTETTVQHQRVLGGKIAELETSDAAPRW
jgi:hypothetical protein